MKSSLKTKIYYIKKALTYIKNYKKLGLLVIFFSVLASIFDGISIGSLIPILQSLTNQGGSEEITSLFPIFSQIESFIFRGSKEETLIFLLIFALFMVILKNIFTYLSNITIQKASSSIKRDLQRNIFKSITEADFSYYHSINSGNIINSVHSYSKGVVAFIFTFLTLSLKTSRILVYLVILLFISWKLTLIAILLELLLLPIIRIILNKIKNINISISRELDGLSSKLIEVLKNIPLIKISNTEKEEQNKFNLTTNNLAELEYKEIKFTKLTPLIAEIIVLTSVIAIITASIKFTDLNILSLLPFIIAYLYVFLRLFQEINGFLTAVSSMFQKIVAFKIYENRLNEAKNLKEKVGEHSLTKLTKGIYINNVSFKYKNEKQYAIKNLTTSIKKGEFTAIIGPTGSGKTTLINLLAGLLLPTKGEIYIDENNITDINQLKWRKSIGFINQDPTLFNDTISYNISYGSDAKSKSDIIEAAKIANIHKFITTLPNKYETIIGENGSKLSGGQKQRIAIARAIIKNPEVLILDEATSSLDSATEKEVQNAIEKAMQNRTVIAIAHRLSTIKKADNIIVLYDGQIIEQGSHDKLIKKQGIYKQYYELQFKD